MIDIFLVFEDSMKNMSKGTGIILMITNYLD